MRYETMLPHQIREAIERRWPVVLPLGVLEYHGEHMAVGMDTLAVVKILEILEAEMNLIILPPFYYGAASYAVSPPEGNGSLHGETDAFRNAGRQRSYRKLIMVTTLAPCWYCSGLVRQFGFRTLIVGESRNFQGGVEWLRSLGIEVIDLDSKECTSLLSEYIRTNPAIWNEDIGEE